MREGIVSDTHGDAAAFRRVLERAGHCDHWLHAGDVLSHGYYYYGDTENGPLALVDLLRELPDPYYVCGNCDYIADGELFNADLSRLERRIRLMIV